MPLTKKGNEIMSSMKKTYKNMKKAKQVFYASKTAGKIKGVDKTENPKQTKKVNPVLSVAGKKGAMKKKLSKIMKMRK